MSGPSARVESRTSESVKVKKVVIIDRREIMLDFSRFGWVSFDCYGTLVDWETGISGAVSEVLESRVCG